MKIDVGLHGFRELSEVLEAMAESEIKKAQIAACKAGGEVMKEAIQERTPVKSGKLKKSIKSGPSKKNKDRHREIEYIVGPTATVDVPQTSKKKMHAGKPVNPRKKFRYGYKVEVDTPYIRPAVDLKGGEVLDVVEETYIKEIKEFWKA